MAIAVATEDPEIAAKDHGGHDTDERQPASQASDPGIGDIDKGLGDAAALHECCGNDKERDCDKDFGFLDGR